MRVNIHEHVGHTAIHGDNLSLVWAQYFNYVMKAGPRASPVSISLMLPSSGLVEEIDWVRRDLDALLAVLREREGKGNPPSIEDNAGVIFPHRLWRTSAKKDASKLYALYPRMYERTRARGRHMGSSSQYGTYFQRMIAYGAKVNDIVDADGELRGKNQLLHIVNTWRKAKSGSSPRSPRESALQIAIFDPKIDHTGQSLRGFPCLQQVGLHLEGDIGFTLWALYPTQDVTKRAYGNYLGLCRLGEFLSNEFGIPFLGLMSYIPRPKRDVPLSSAQSLIDDLDELLRPSGQIHIFGRAG